ncbi:MAG: hypothetical protein RQ875_06615 [Vicingaceae bacterium]|nr:hypothetical protein [Vicingaceae bacterium]
MVFFKNLFSKKKENKPSNTNVHHRDLMRMICWMEIPVKDIKRAINFYKNVFKSEFEYQVFNNVGYAFFKSIDGSFKGTLIETNQPINGNGILLFIKVEGFVTTALKNVPLFGGEILEDKKMITNKVDDQTSIIANNFIDGGLGYVAKIKDSEGNVMVLYSNS